MEATILFISGPEIFIVLLVVLLLFGSKKIPELARGLGRGMQEFKKATDDIKREFNENENLRDVKDTANEISEGIKKGRKVIENNDVVKKINKDIDDVNNNIGNLNKDK